MPSGGSGVTENSGSSVLYTVAPERRINPFRPELRTADGGSGPKHIVGYASVFDKLSRSLGGFVERVNPAAFRSSKAEGFPGVVCRFNHNDDFLLGTTQGNTLVMDFDNTGLAYDVIPPSLTHPPNLMELMQRGDVTSSSFAFRVPEGGDDWALSDFGMPLRTLLNVELVDVAPVTTPAYPDATAQARSIEGAVNSLAARFDADPTEIRSLLSNKQAKKLFARSDMITPSAPEVPEIAEEAEMTLDEQRMALYEAETREKYSTDDRKKLAAKGHAMKDGSYPIVDEEDLHNAIHAVGRGKNNSHDAIRAHIKKRASAMGKTAMLPEEWTDGPSSPPVSSSNSVEDNSEIRADSKSKADSDEDEDEDDDQTTDSSTEETNSAPEAEEDRAAKASYEDLQTCGKCGTPDQMGKHCVNCGNSMEPPMAQHGSGKFCGNCGGKMPVAPAKREDHKCAEEQREEAPAVSTDTGKLPGNELPVGNGEDQLAKIGLSRRNMLLAKRYDPYIDSEDGE